MKKILIPFIMLIVGLAAGYLLCKSTSKNFVSENSNELTNQETLTLGNTPDSVITNRALAQRLIAKFQIINLQLPTRLNTEKGQPLRGFYIPRKDLDEILSNKDAAGVSLYFAKHRDHDNVTDRIFTLVFRGAKLKGTKQNPDDIEGYGEYYDYIKPCPTVCGE